MAARVAFVASLLVRATNGNVVEAREQLTYWYAEVSGRRRPGSWMGCGTGRLATFAARGSAATLGAMTPPSSPCKRWLHAAALAVAALSAPAAARSEVISGVIDEWPESEADLFLGDGVNSVRISWSLQYYNTGFFYGRGDFRGSSEVVVLPDITDVSEITDASAFTYVSYPPSGVGPLCDAECDPDGVGDFVAFHSLDNGHFLVLRIDDIRVDDLAQSIAFLDGTWWFQTDGTGDFVVPEAPRAALLAVALGALALRSLAGRKRRAAARG